MDSSLFDYQNPFTFSNDIEYIKNDFNINQELVLRDELSPSVNQIFTPVNNIIEPETISMSASEKKKKREYARNLTCFNCKTTKSPLWRKTEDKVRNVCNACGLYYKQYKSNRPVSYKNRAPRVSKKMHNNQINIKTYLQTLKTKHQNELVTLSVSQLNHIINFVISDIHYSGNNL